MNRSERRRLAKQRQKGGQQDPAARAAEEARTLQHLNEAVREIEAGRPKEAARLCRQLLKRQPDHPEALNLAGIAAFHSGDSERALKHLRAATARQPDHADSHNNLGNVLRMTGAYGEAEEAYRRALAIEPAHRDAPFNLGLVLEALDRPAEAIEAYRRVMELRPDFADGQLSLANALKALGRLDEAEEAYRRAIELAPQTAPARINLGVVLRERGRLDEAVEAYREAIALAPQTADAHYNLGVALQDQERLEEAEASYRHVLSLAPDYVPALVNLGYARQKSGDLGAAISAFERALALAPDMADALVNLAEARLEAGDPGQALADCETFLAEHPGNTAVLAFKAVLLNELGQTAAQDELLDSDRFLTATRFAQAPDGRPIADLNAALVEHLLAHPSLVEAPASHATKDGRHSGELLAEPKGPVALLEEMILQAVEVYRAALPGDLEHAFVRAAPARCVLSVWGVVLTGAGHQIPHIHPSAWLSGVYYPQVPEGVDEAGQGQAGWIEFGRPPEHFHCRAAPRVVLHRPEEGLMLLFPSYAYHRTIPFSGDRQRVSIAFDLRPLG